MEVFELLLASVVFMFELLLLFFCDLLLLLAASLLIITADDVFDFSSLNGLDGLLREVVKIERLLLPLLLLLLVFAFF
jgi:hypothetical protein